MSNSSSVKCTNCIYHSDNLHHFRQCLDQNQMATLWCLDCVNKAYPMALASPLEQLELELVQDEKQYMIKKLMDQCPIPPKTEKDTPIFPQTILEIINSKVVGQMDAKRKISIAIANHLQRINNPDLTIKKSNVLLIGPSGTGKTEIFRSLSEELSIPFSIFDASSLTASGYVGSDVDQILVGLMSKSFPGSSYKAEHGIVFIDEFDKLAKFHNPDSSVNTSRVQQELLKLIEGSEVKVNLGGKMNPNYVTVDTSNILFICAGAFEGLEGIVSQTSDKVMGILKEDPKKEDLKPWMSKVTTEHLQKYGIITEILGRIPVIAYTKHLDKFELYQILTEPKDNIVSQYKNLFSTFNIDLELTNDFLGSVVDQAVDLKIGARGLQSIIENKLELILFDAHKYSGKRVSVTRNNVVLKSTEDKLETVFN